MTLFILPASSGRNKARAPRSTVSPRTAGLPAGGAASYAVDVPLFESLVPVFALICLGAVLRRVGWLAPQIATELNRVVANVALPALLLAKVGTASLELAWSGRVVAVTCLVTGLGSVIVLFGSRLVGLPANQWGVTTQAATRGNIAYVAFPLVLHGWGDDAFRMAAVTAALLIPVMNVLSVGVLEHARGRGMGVWRSCTRVIVNPLVVATLSGLALAELHWQPWRWLRIGLDTLGGLALPGALLALGALANLASLHRVWRPAVVASTVKLGVLPLVGWLVLRKMDVSPIELAIGVVMLGVPTAVASFPVATDLEGDPDLAAACVVLSTISALPALAMWGVLLAVR